MPGRQSGGFHIAQPSQLLPTTSYHVRAARIFVLRKGKREKNWLNLDPLVARLVQAWLARTERGEFDAAELDRCNA